MTYNPYRLYAGLKILCEDNKPSELRKNGAPRDYSLYEQMDVNLKLSYSLDILMNYKK